MSDNRKLKNKTEALNEEAKKKELSMENLEQVTGGVYDERAERVIRGDYGNGQERRRCLREAEFDYGDVQN